jgi:hypothetical protein
MRMRIAGLEEQWKLIGSVREESATGSWDDQTSGAKYRQLAEYMEEYISNTNEAHHHFNELIEDLRA